MSVWNKKVGSTIGEKYISGLIFLEGKKEEDFNPSFHQYSLQTKIKLLSFYFRLFQILQGTE